MSAANTGLTGTDKLATSAATAIDTTTNGVASAASAVANSSTAKSLDNALATMINTSVQGAGDAIAWAKYQIPDVIHQLLVWKAVESFITFSVWMLLTFAIYAVVGYLINYARKASRSFDTFNCYFPASLLFLSGLGTFAAMCNNMDWLKIWIAPKIYLLEYATQLLKGTH